MRKSNWLGLCQFIIVRILLSYAWRIGGGAAQESLWRDEIVAIYFGLEDLECLSTMLAEPDQNGPLYYLSRRVWLNLVSPSEVALRYLSLLFDSLTIPLTWQVARRLLSLSNSEFASPAIAKKKENQANGWLLSITEPVVLTATFLAVNPHQLWYS